MLGPQLSGWALIIIPLRGCWLTWRCLTAPRAVAVHLGLQQFSLPQTLLHSWAVHVCFCTIISNGRLLEGLFLTFWWHLTYIEVHWKITVLKHLSKFPRWHTQWGSELGSKAVLMSKLLLFVNWTHGHRMSAGKLSYLSLVLNKVIIFPYYY